MTTCDHGVPVCLECAAVEWHATDKADQEVLALRARLALAERVVTAGQALIDAPAWKAETAKDDLRAALAAWREGEP